MEKKRMSIFGMIVLIAILLLASPFSSVESVEAKSQMPEIIGFLTLPMGSSAYIFSAALAEVIQDQLGVKVRVVPLDTETGKMLALRNKKGHISITSAGGAYPIAAGMDLYNKPDWGPQPLRVVWLGGNICMGVVTRKDSGIEKWEDISGKRYPSLRFSWGAHACQHAGLLYAGLKYEDVEEVKLSSTKKSYTGVKDGIFEVSVLGSNAGGAQELSASIHGIRWLSMDPTTELGKEGWKRVKSVYPYMGPSLLDFAAGMKGPQDAKWFLGYPYCIFSYQMLEEEVAYGVTKSLWYNYDKYKDKHAALAGWTQKQALNLDFMTYPYHPGSIKFFKEINKWTDEHEKRQQTLIKNETDRRKAWEAKMKK